MKYSVHGFRNRKRFRNAICFHLGGLDLYPGVTRCPPFLHEFLKIPNSFNLSRSIAYPAGDNIDNKVRPIYDDFMFTAHLRRGSIWKYEVSSFRQRSLSYTCAT